LDNNATTRVAPEVVEAMLPFLTTHWGNPSSAYSFGSRLIKDIQEAHAKVAALINADPKEIIFTSCGTESSNAALHSALTLQPQKRHVLTTTVEHSATMKYGRYLQNRGFEVTYLPVEPDGSLDLHLLDQSIRPDTAIVSVMWANNETGILFPIEEIAAICRSKGVHFHTDAVQAAGKVKVDVKAAGVDLLSLSAHKIHAPKGIGALYVRREVPFQPYIMGGNQEAGRRAGTENVPYMVAYGRAAELAWGRLADADTRVRQLRDRMEQGILRSVPNTMRNGAPEPRLPNTANITFDLVEAEAVLAGLDQLGICVSSGSACTTGSLAPSHVLTAMGLSPARARGAIRFSLGYENTDADVDYLLKHLPPLIARVREAPTKSASARDQEEPPTATVSENVVVSKAGALLTP
jgi:cysteine desulfurase